MRKENILKEVMKLKAAGDFAVNMEDVREVALRGDIDPVDVFYDASGQQLTYYLMAIELMESITDENSSIKYMNRLLVLYDRALKVCSYDDRTRHKINEKKARLLEWMKKKRS